MCDVLISVDKPEQGLVAICEACNLERQGSSSSLLWRLWELEWLVRGEYLEYFNCIRSYYLVNEHFVVAECLVLSFLAVLEVQLLKNIEVVQVNEVPLYFRPKLSSIAARRKLNAHKLGVIVWPGVVDNHEEFRDVSGLGDRAIKDGVILASCAPLEARSTDSFFLFQQVLQGLAVDVFGRFRCSMKILHKIGGHPLFQGAPNEI